MVFKPKKKAIPVPEEAYDEPEEEEEEYEEEDEEDEPVSKKMVQKEKTAPQTQISRQEFADMLEGTLNRALHLVQYLRQA